MSDTQAREHLAMEADVAHEVRGAGVSHPQRKSSIGRIRAMVIPAITLLSVAVLVELWVRIGDVPRYIFPKPTDIVAAMIDDFSMLVPHMWATAQAMTFGFLLAVVIGILLSLAIVSYPPFERAVFPLILATQLIPKVALAPVFLIWLGFGIASKVMIVFLLSFFPIVINSILGFRSLDHETMQLAQSTGAGSFRTFRLIRLPNALPTIFGGLKLAVTLATIGAIIGELVGADQGLGYLLLQSIGVINTELVFAIVAYLTIFGIVAFGAVVLVERLAIPWHISKRRA